MLDGEVRYLPGVIPDRLDHEHRVGQAVEQGVDAPASAARRLGLRAPGARRAPGAQPGGQGGQPLADLGREGRDRLWPNWLSMTPSSSPLCSRSARTARAPPGVPGDRDAGPSSRRPRAPPQVGGAAGRSAARGQSSCGGTCRQRPVSPLGRPVSPSSESAPSALEQPEHQRRPRPAAPARPRCWPARHRRRPARRRPRPRGEPKSGSDQSGAGAWVGAKVRAAHFLAHDRSPVTSRTGGRVRRQNGRRHLRVGIPRSPRPARR